MIVFTFIYFKRTKTKPHPRSARKTKSLRSKEQFPDTNLAERHSNFAVQQTNLKGEKYIPSYQSNPDAVKHVERFLQGAIKRGDNSKAEKQIGTDEDVTNKISLGDKTHEHPAGERDEKETVKIQEAMQLELGIEDTTDKLSAVNE
jgi:hypothetical protein